MKVVHGLSALGWVAGLGLLFGCGGSAKEKVSGGRGIRKIAVANLPKLGAPLPQALDGGRVTISPPSGWEISPRDSRWLIRFQEDPHESYPSIIIKAEDATGSIRDVTRESIHDFADQVAAELRQAKSQKTVIEQVQVGSFVGVDYERRGKAKSDYKTIIVERLILETVVGGRRYSIDLRTRDQDLHRYRPHALAVAGGMEFQEAGGSAGPEAGADHQPALPEAPEEPGAEPEPEKKPPEKSGEEEPDLEFEEE